MNRIAPILEIKKASFAYGREIVLENFSLAVARGEIVTLLGPTGCGKSTLLRMIVGLESLGAGHIYMDDSTRSTVYLLFQNYDAYPWLTVWDNVQLGSGAHPVPDHNVQQTLAMVGLSKHKDKFPGELSGGMNKRLALARILVRQPALLLMDEPFSSLDLASRFEMYVLIQRMIESSNSRLGSSMILVTHNIQEAILLSDRILVLSSRPMRLIEEVSVPLPWPRGQDCFSMDEFSIIEQHLTRLITERVKE